MFRYFSFVKMSRYSTHAQKPSYWLFAMDDLILLCCGLISQRFPTNDGNLNIKKKGLEKLFFFFFSPPTPDHKGRKPNTYAASSVARGYHTEPVLSWEFVDYDLARIELIRLKGEKCNSKHF